MKYARYALLMASLFFPACQNEVNEVTAPAQPPPPPRAGAAEWGPARTWTPNLTPSRTPTLTRTPTITPTPPLDLDGPWVGTFRYYQCNDDVTVQLFQTGNDVYGWFFTNCYQEEAWFELRGALQGQTLHVTLFYNDAYQAHLHGPASPTTISVWNSTNMIGLSLGR